MRNFLRRNAYDTVTILMIFAIAAITYLPHIFQFTYFRDDWYYMADGYFGGQNIFNHMFFIDRPFRGKLFEYLFSFFNINPLPYHLLSWLWRIFSGVFCYLLFCSIWPTRKGINRWIALLFVVYPGFLWWVAGVEYQPNLLSLCLLVTSIWFTILSVVSTSKWLIKVLFFGLSVLTGWAYIFLVDFMIGIELFRLVCVLLALVQRYPNTKFITLLKKGGRYFVPYLTIPAGYLLWRIFIFENLRQETDINLQWSLFLASPFTTFPKWIVSLVESFFNISVRGWISPFFDNLFTQPAITVIVLLLIGVVVAILVNVISGLIVVDKEVTDINWIRIAILGAVIGIIGSVVPVVIMNRTVRLEDLSHYSLAGSLPAAVLIVAGIYLIRYENYRKVLFLVLLGMAVVSQHSLARNVIAEQRVIQNFWQQMSFRAPELASTTTLLINYPGITYGEETDFVWAPLNFAYLKKENVVMSSGAINYPYSSVKNNYLTLKEIIVGDDPIEAGYRTHLFLPDYENLLVISQPTTSSCVHVIDSRWPRLSIYDSDQVLLGAKYSNIEVILDSTDWPKLDPIVFGDEPVNDWCKYYEKAEYYLQIENINEVYKLYEQVLTNDLRPGDKVEWMPYLQAVMLLEDEHEIQLIASFISEDPFLMKGACDLLTALPENGYPLSDQIIVFSAELLCK